MPQPQVTTIPFRARTNPVVRLAFSVVKGLRLALTRRRDRQLLARLDAHLLRDIGLSPDEARTESAKPFWQP